MIREFVEAFRVARAAQKIGIKEKLCIVTEREFCDQMNRMNLYRKREELYNECLLGLFHGRSACPYCEDRDDCPGDTTGCDGWWLRYLKDDELESVMTHGDPETRAPVE